MPRWSCTVYMDTQQQMAESAFQFLERRRSSAHSIGSLQPDLYTRRGSSITQESTSGRPPVGRLRLQLFYDFAKSDLVVSLLQVEDFAHIEDFYFAVIFEGYPTRETQKYSSETDFSPEHFKYAITFEEVIDKSITVRLMETAKNGSSQDVIASAIIDLSSLNPSGEIFVWTTLDASEQRKDLGELLIGMQYLTSAERLTVIAHQARNLKHTTLPDGCVRVNLIEDGKIQKKRKSSVRRASDCPVWNEALSFNVAPDALARIEVEVTVVDYDRIGNHKTIGKIVFGKKYTERLWKELVSGESIIPKWIPLKSP